MRKSARAIASVAVILGLSLAVEPALAETQAPVAAQHFTVNSGQTLRVPVSCGKPSEICSWVFTAKGQNVRQVLGPSDLIYIDDTCEAAGYDGFDNKVTWLDQNQNVIYDTTNGGVYLESEYHGAGANYPYTVSSPPGNPTVNPGYDTWTNDLYVANAAVFVLNPDNVYHTSSINYHSGGVYDHYQCNITVQ